MPRKPGSDSSDTALFGMLKDKFSSMMSKSKPKPASRSARGVTVASGKVADIRKPSAPKATPMPAPKPKPTSSSSSTTVPRMSAAERKANATRKEPPAKAAPQPKVSVREARPAYTDVSSPPRMPRNFGKPETKKDGGYTVYDKNSDEAKDFRSAFAAARKAGKDTFTWQGRKYTTEVKK